MGAVVRLAMEGLRTGKLDYDRTVRCATTNPTEPERGSTGCSRGGTRLEKRAIKNNRMVRAELPKAVIDALEMLPPPKAAGEHDRRYFAKDTATLRSLVKGAGGRCRQSSSQAGPFQGCDTPGLSC